VESKSFKIVRYANELHIIERGKNHLSHVTMGLVTARWFRDTLLELVSLPLDQNAFRSLREGNKVLLFKNRGMERAGSPL
jgi:hypothetical protein